MKTWSVDDVMTKVVLSVDATASYRDVVDLLIENKLSAVPVVDAFRHVVGVVSEADLLRVGRKSRAGRRRYADPGRLAAGQLMTSPAVTVRSDDTLAHAAKLLADSGRRQLFVVDDGRLVGALARRDVLSLFLRPDQEIRAEVEHAVFGGPQEPSVQVEVDRGVVRLTGWLPARADIDAAVERIADIPGVIGIRDRLVAAFDDRRGRHGLKAR